MFVLRFLSLIQKFFCVLQLKIRKVKVSFGQRPGEDLETMLKQSSDLLFCDEGGNITCCFANEICEDSSDLQENQVNFKRYKGNFSVQLVGASLGFEYC